MNMEGLIFVGQLFQSYEQFETCLKDYCQTNYVQFYKRSTRTIHSARVTRPLNPRLRYYEVNLCCVHGGPFKERGKGIRESSSLKQDCNAKIVLKASEDGEALQVKVLDENHNHPVSKALFSNLPQVRRVCGTGRRRARNSLSLKANKKLIQQDVMEETGDHVGLNELSDFASQLENNGEHILQSTVDVLTGKYEAEVELLIHNEEFKGMYFITREMKEVLQAYPDYISIDGAHKLLDIGATPFLVLVEDSQGSSQLVSVCLLMEGNYEGFHWFLSMFKNHNPSISPPHYIMTDEDLVLREVLKEAFPTSQTVLSLREFYRELTKDRMGITNEERTVCLEIQQKLCSALNEDIFEHVLNELREKVPEKVQHYFFRNWYPVREEWSHIAFANAHNRIESIHGKLKLVIPKNSDLMEFVNGFFVVYNSLSKERDQKLLNMIQKRYLKHFKAGSAEKRYCELLTPYAAQFVLGQLNDREQTAKLLTKQSRNEAVFASSGRQIQTSSSSCTCKFNVAMGLPCCHIFVLRKMRNLPLFSADLCKQQWTRQHCLRLCKSSADISDQSTSSVAVSVLPIHQVTTCCEKRKKATLLCNSLAEILSLSSEDDFERRLEQLRFLKTLWETGREIVIESLIDDSKGFEVMFGTSNVMTSVTKEHSIVVGSQIEIEDVEWDKENEVTKENKVSTTGSQCEESEVEEYHQENQITQGNMTAIHTSETDLINALSEVRVKLAPEGQQQAGLSLSDIKMPVATKTRVRLRGHEEIVIGLPKKISKKENN